MLSRRVLPWLLCAQRGPQLASAAGIVEAPAVSRWGSPSPLTRGVKVTVVACGAPALPSWASGSSSFVVLLLVLVLLELGLLLPRSRLLGDVA